jgi:UDP-3-O-[3-hydroxymyristoyl] glucosamine N-acyltransferase
VPQLGGTILEADVEVGANSTIDCGTFAPTRIGAGTKIDNQVMVSHNCRIGRHNILVSQAGLAGSCVTGDYVVLAGQVGIADHITIGDRTVVGAQAGVISDLPADVQVLGSPAMPIRDFFKAVAEWGKAAAVRRDVAKIKKHLKLDDTEGG